MVLLFVYLLIAFVFVFLITNPIKKKYFSKNVQVLATSGVEMEKKISEISLDFHYRVNIYYPYSSYSLLNQEIEKFITNWLEKLWIALKESGNVNNQFYTLDIHYDTYIYQKYISYVFTCFLDTGGAHPNTYIETISFDTETNTQFTIESFQERNHNIFSEFSEISRELLFLNKSLLEDSIWDMVLEGTSPIARNFRNFAFSEQGILLFFERYQIAPYSYGTYQVLIPYSKINFQT